MSGTPPAFNPPQQSGNKIWLWVLLAVALFCIVCIVGLFFMVKSAMNTGMGLVSCMANGELAHDAVLAYAMDHDDTLPNAETWQDDIRPYYERLYTKLIGEMGAEEMPSWLNFDLAKPGEVSECDLGGGKMTGFSFNAAYSGKKLSEIDDHTKAIVIWENPKRSYNGFGDPGSRDSNDPVLSIFGDRREWMDFPIDGEPNPFKSGNSDFNFDIRPEDGLEKEGESGAEEPAEAIGA